MTETFTLTASDGHTIHGRHWKTADAPKLVVQMMHGMGEHIGRYEDFALHLVERDFAVVGHNHRGHGQHAEQRGHFADSNGWEKVCEDAISVHEHAGSLYPGVPRVLFGHSMGSFVAQDVASRLSSLVGLALSGSTWPNRFALAPGWLMTRIVMLANGRTGYSPSLDNKGLNALNRKFEPARTDSDWLTRDEEQVDIYLADPLCGGPFTTGYWSDFIGGLLHVGSDALLNRIASDLPIFIFGGSEDPVGGDKGLGKLVTHYAQTGHQRLKIKIYDGGRHEMLNETNRDEVFRDFTDWLGPIAR